MPKLIIKFLAKHGRFKVNTLSLTYIEVKTIGKRNITQVELQKNRRGRDCSQHSKVARINVISTKDITVRLTINNLIIQARSGTKKRMPIAQTESISFRPRSIGITIVDIFKKPYRLSQSSREKYTDYTSFRYKLFSRPSQIPRKTSGPSSNVKKPASNLECTSFHPSLVNPIGRSTVIRADEGQTLAQNTDKPRISMACASFNSRLFRSRGRSKSMQPNSYKVRYLS